VYACTLLKLWTKYIRIWSFSQIGNYGTVHKTVIFPHAFRSILQNIYVFVLLFCYFFVITWKLWQYVLCYVCWHAASSDGVARLWNVETGAVEREYNGHQKAVTSLAFRDEIIREWSFVCVCVCVCVRAHGVNWDAVCVYNTCGWIKSCCFKTVKYWFNLYSSLIFPRNHHCFQSPWSTRPAVCVCTIADIANWTKCLKNPSRYSPVYMLCVMWSEWRHLVCFYNICPQNIEYEGISSSSWTQEGNICLPLFVVVVVPFKVVPFQSYAVGPMFLPLLEAPLHYK
jgi:WD40 repeat protein